MSDEEIDKAAKGILYLILTRLMEDFAPVARCASSAKWQETLDDLEKDVAEALCRHVRPL